jgi:hypothetical protein
MAAILPAGNGCAPGDCPDAARCSGGHHGDW